MKILFLPAYFYPESEPGSHLADNRNEAFARAGFEMVVIAPDPVRGISEEQRKEYRKKRKERLHGGALLVYRFPMFSEGKNLLIRALRYTLCSTVQFFKGWNAKNIDALFISSTPPIQGAMAALLKIVKRVPLVYCLQDIFPDSMVSAGLTKNGSLIWKAGRTMERFTYRHANKIIVISQDFKQNIMAKGVPEDKIEVIYNWVDEQAVTPINRADNKLFDKYGLHPSHFYIAYCGNIGHTQNLEMLLEVAKDMTAFETIRFVLIGDGACKNKIQSLIAEQNIKNVTLLPFQPYKDISHVFSLGDAGLIISKPGVGMNSVPSKTWSIMSAQRAVIASFDENELKHIITGNRCGLFAKAGNKEALIGAVLTLFHNREECRCLGVNARNYILKNLNRDESTQRYVRIMQQITSSTKSTGITHHPID
jgi:glycosyltransferase involved in cell wall biosynthesis